MMRKLFIAALAAVALAFAAAPAQAQYYGPGYHRYRHRDRDDRYRRPPYRRYRYVPRQPYGYVNPWGSWGGRMIIRRHYWRPPLPDYGPGYGRPVFNGWIRHFNGCWNTTVVNGVPHTTFGPYCLYQRR